MDAKVRWNGKLSFIASADSGFELPLDSQNIYGGDDSGFRPMELILIGLAGCTAMDVISILTKKRQEVTNFEVCVHAERAEQHPRVFTTAQIEYIITGHKVSEAAVVRSIELSTTTYCPAHAMLGKIMPITLKYSIYEEQSDGQPSLVAIGTCQPPEQYIAK